MYKDMLKKIENDITKKKKGYYIYVIIPKVMFDYLIEENEKIGIKIIKGEEKLFGVRLLYSDKMLHNEYIIARKGVN